MRNRCLTIFFILGVLFSCTDPPDAVPEKQQIISVYPNPANEYAFVRTDRKGTIKVINPEGDVIDVKESPSDGLDAELINLHDEPRGYYHAVFETSSGIVTVKFIKQ